MSHQKPRVIFVLGGPGSGKGTHCEQLRDRHHFIHFSVGDILRQYLKEGAKDSLEIIKLMKEGKMVPSKPIIERLKSKILKGGNNQVYLIDGFPRNLDNYQNWKAIVGDAVEVKLLIYVQVEDEEMRRRLLNRGKTSGRVDDNAEVIEKRLKTFHEETEPVVRLFKQNYKQGIGKVISVNGILSINEAQERLRKALHKGELI